MVDIHEVAIHEVAPYHPDADRFAHEPTFVQARVGHGSDDAAPWLQ